MICYRQCLFTLWTSQSSCCSGSGQGAQLGVFPPQCWTGDASAHPEACSILDHQCAQTWRHTTCSTICRGSSWTCWHRWGSCPTTSPPCQGRPTAEKMSQPPAPPAKPEEEADISMVLIWLSVNWASAHLVAPHTVAQLIFPTQPVLHLFDQHQYNSQTSCRLSTSKRRWVWRGLFQRSSPP